MLNDIKIISADPSYAQTLTDIGRKLFAMTFCNDTSPENMEQYLNESYVVDIQFKELNDPDIHTFIAFENDKAVGFAQLNQKKAPYEFINDPEAIELQRIYVDSNYKGKGVAQQLIGLCLKKAQELEKKTVWLGVWEENHRAKKFYENHGFHKVGTHTFRMGDQLDTDNVMIKRLL